MEYKTVTIPACEQHEGYKTIDVRVKWVCPVCGKPRGKVHTAVSYDGSLRLVCDGWENPCGHVDKYEAVRKEGMEESMITKKFVVVECVDRELNLLGCYDTHNEALAKMAEAFYEVNKKYTDFPSVDELVRKSQTGDDGSWSFCFDSCWSNNGCSYDAKIGLVDI